jgi:hypothetical protein
MSALTPITVTVRELDSTLWALFTKPGPLTAEERALLDAAEAAYVEEGEAQ